MNRDDREIFGTLKEEAKLNVKRIDPMGKELQAHTMRLFVQPGLDALAKAGAPDIRCSTCAARPGTVPGGCLVTQADFQKAILENVPFMCHSHMEDGEPDRVCHGWLAARVTTGSKTIRAPWPWADEAIAAASGD